MFQGIIFQWSLGMLTLDFYFEARRYIEKDWRLVKELIILDGSFLS